MTGIESFIQHIIQEQQSIADLVCQKMICQSEIIFVVQYIQVLDYALIADVSAGKADHLVEDRQGITHTTVSFQGNYIQCFRFGGNSFL